MSALACWSLDVTSVVRDTTAETFTEDSGNENRSKKSLQSPSIHPIFGVQTANTYHVSLSRQHWESDPVAGRKSSLGTSDCQGELSALFGFRKKFGLFATKVCDAANLFMRIPHRSGRTSFSSRFRRPSSLIWLAALGEPSQ